MLIQMADLVKERERQEQAQETRMGTAADFACDTVYFYCVHCGRPMHGRRSDERTRKRLCADCEVIVNVKLDQAETAVAVYGDPNIDAVTRGTKPVTGTVVRRMLPGEDGKA
jgi:hypothetical protein